MDEPELHLGDDILVPDLAGWRRARLPALPDEPYLTLAPGWVCEVLSPTTAKTDRAGKLPIYARESIRHAWLIDPLQHTLEALRLDGEHDTLLGVHTDEAVVNSEPFEVFDLQLSVLWADVEQPR